MLTNSHAVRDRLTLKDVKKRQFRIESNYRDLKSSNTQRNSNNYSKITQTYTNTNSLVHSQFDDPLDSLEPPRSNFMSRSWPFYLKISLLGFVLICYALKSYFDSYVLLFLSSIPVICPVVLFHLVLQFIDYFVCLANECCMFEKAEDLFSHAIIAESKRSELRSRYAKFLASECISLKLSHVIQNQAGFQSRNSHEL